MNDTRPKHIDYARVIGIYIVIIGHYAYALGFPFEKQFIVEYGTYNNIVYFLILFASRYAPILLGNRKIE